VREKRIRARRRGRSLALGLRLLRREWRSGELRVLAVALLVAVGAVTAVGAFTDRIERGMERGASQLLGADLIVLASDPIPEPLARAAAQGGLDAARTVTFRSVVVAGERFQLAAVKAVDGRYPLEGSLRIADAPFAAGRAPSGSRRAWPASSASASASASSSGARGRWSHRSSPTSPTAAATCSTSPRGC
jgi:putative ABC transport system permease protein